MERGFQDRLDKVGLTISVRQVESIQTAWDELTRGEYGLLLLDSLVEDQIHTLQTDCPPIMLLVDEDEEVAAVNALERGAIADYVLTRMSGYKRLPLAIRATLARENHTKLRKSLENIDFLTQLDGSFDAYVVVDQNGKLTSRTRISALWTGYTEDEFYSLKPFELIHPEDASSMYLPLFSDLVATPGREENVRLRDLAQGWDLALV